MKMQKLTSPETRIVRSMLIKQFGPQSPFLAQLSSAKFPARHLTGKGYFIDLEVGKGIKPVDRLNTELTDARRTLLPEPCDLVGFVLFIRDGFLNSLEGYTYGDVKWPEEPMEDWLQFEEISMDDSLGTDEIVNFSKFQETFTPSGLAFLRDPPASRDIWSLHT
jgi:hypothetical protein